MEFYNKKIQLHIDVVKDILSNIRPRYKMLVFGLGYDSNMWHNANSEGLTVFVEEHTKWIDLNKNIPRENVVQYKYPFKMTEKPLNLEPYEPPQSIFDRGPYDIIIIDGPGGHNNKCPGRLIAYYWSTLVSKPGTLVYMDDAKRPLEKYCINRFYNLKDKFMFQERKGCVRITV